MRELIPYFINGISVGGQYALIAIGYTLVYGILRLINFAHGDVFMCAGLIMIYAVTWMPLYIAIPFTLLVTVLIGFLIERVAYKPLRTAPRMSVMISAIGVSYLLQNVALYVTGGLAKMYPTIPWISNTVTIGTATTKVVTIITPILTLVLVIALVTFIQKTKIGMAMRAVSKDFETSQLMGIKINNVISATHLRRYARPEGLRGGGVRRHRQHTRRGNRRVYNRYLRKHNKGPGLDHLLRRLYLRPAHNNTHRQAYRPLR